MPIRYGRAPKPDLETFLSRTEGSVATIFAVSIIPVMMAVGVGVDLSRMMTSRSHLQDALDATALALAHMPTNTPQTVLDQKAAAWMAANLKDGSMEPPTVTVKLSKGLIELDAVGKVPTTVTAIAGYKTMDVAAHSSVKWGIGRAEVVLVLDNTGSMEGTKLTRLKDAAKKLVDTLEAQVSSSDPTMLRVGVVPFSIAVRLSDSTTDLATYKTSTWITGTMPADYGADLFVDKVTGADKHMDRWALFTAQGQPWAGCVEQRPEPYDVSDTAPDPATPKSMFVPYFAPDEPDKDRVKKNNGDDAGYTSENNYIADSTTNNKARDISSAYKDSASKRWFYIQGYPDKYTASKVTSSKVADGYGPNAGCNMVPLLRLTNNLTTVRSRLTAMRAVGNTNIPNGLMWGWHLLSPYGPFGDGVAYTNTETKKFIVLLTDGDNTNATSNNPNNSEYSTIGYAWQNRMPELTASLSASDRTKKMDKRLATLCQNIKDAKITIYAVRIDMSGNAPAALSGCATEASYFYNIDSTGLSKAFEEIAGSIGKLRIAQ